MTRHTLPTQCSQLTTSRSTVLRDYADKTFERAMFYVDSYTTWRELVVLLAHHNAVMMFRRATA